MKEWKKVKLGEVLTSVIGGGTPSKSVPNYWNGNIFWCSVKDMSDDKHFLYSTQDCITKDGLENSNAKIIKEGTVIISTRMGLGRAFINKVDMAINQDLKALVPNEKIDNSFLLWSIISKRQELLTMGRGSTVSGITIDMLKNIEIVLPPLPIQRRISGILSRYDALIENSQKQIKLLEEAAQRLYKHWFVDMKFPGHENATFDNGLPTGWTRKKIGEVCDIVMGQSPKSEFYNNEQKGLPFHQGVGSYGDRFVNDVVYTTSFTRIAEPYSILFSVRAPVGRLNITKNKIVIGRGIASMNHKEGKQSFLFYMLKERFFKDDIIGNGSIFASIAKNDLLELQFDIPTNSLIDEFENFVSKFDAKIANLDTQLRHLAEARDRLLPRLMSGEIEVS